MDFNIEHYRKTKKQVIDEIKKTLPYWEKTEGFIADGLITPDIYGKQKLKICCLLGESYGYSACNVVDIETQPCENILGVGNSKQQTAKKIPTLLWLIFKSIEKGEKISYKEFREMSLLQTSDENTEILQEAISKIGWVNVKKASRDDGTKQNDKEIYDHAIKNKDILRLQIESISPNLIIACSNPVFNSLYKMELLGGEIEEGKKDQIQINKNEQKIFQVSHPSYYKDWGYCGIYNKFETIYGTIMP